MPVDLLPAWLRLKDARTQEQAVAALRHNRWIRRELILSGNMMIAAYLLWPALRVLQHHKPYPPTIVSGLLPLFVLSLASMRTKIGNYEVRLLPIAAGSTVGAPEQAVMHWKRGRVRVALRAGWAVALVTIVAWDESLSLHRRLWGRGWLFYLVYAVAAATFAGSELMQLRRRREIGRVDEQGVTLDEYGLTVPWRLIACVSTDASLEFHWHVTDRAEVLALAKRRQRRLARRLRKTDALSIDNTRLRELPEDIMRASGAHIVAQRAAERREALV